MAATFVYGVDGVVRIGTVTASYVNSWSMAVNTGVADTPSLGSSGPVRTYTKYKDFTGNITASFRFDSATGTSLAQEKVLAMFVSGGTPAAVRLSLVESSKSMYYGDVVFTNVSKNQAAESVGTWSADWAQANGPLTWINATAT